MLDIAKRIQPDLDTLETDADYHKAAKAIFSVGGRLSHIVCTCGKEGVRWFWHKNFESIETHKYPAIEVKEVVSVQGAGDTFNAGFIGSLFKNYYETDVFTRFTAAIEHGLKCAALTIQSPKNVADEIQKL